MKSHQFGIELAHNFAVKSKTAKFDEVELFRALREAILSTSPHFPVEEYHGAVSQVLFPARPPWTKIPARCELSDLCIIWFRRRPRPEARITFLQAKRSKETHTPCINFGSVTETFKGDSTQWRLLNSRPEIIGCFHTFRPPTNLLKDALLPSVATYGIFHRKPKSGYSFFYASADVTSASKPKKPGNVQLTISAVPAQVTVNGLAEQKTACCPYIFGEALFAGRIGTPIDRNAVTSTADEAWRDSVRRWLGSLLGGALRSNREIPIIRSFFNTLDIPHGDGEASALPAKSILFVQGDDAELGE